MFHETHRYAIILLMVANVAFLAFSSLRGVVSYPSLVSRITGKSKTNSSLTIEQQQPPITIRACLLFYNGIPNNEAFKAWIRYHNKRWGVTHVDVFVTERLEDTKAILNYASQESVKIEVFYSHMHENPVQSLGPRQTVMMNRVLQNAKLDNNTFVLYMDPDEFIVSQDFQDFEQMFERGHVAVSFPMFSSYYHLCSDNALYFGSLGYESIKPYGSNSSTNASLDYYTDPKLACPGHRKFIVRADKWDEIDFVHDPIGCMRDEMDSRIFDLTGRHQDGQHARLLHVRTSVGIQADISMQACGTVRSCKYLTDRLECTNQVEDATWELKKSEMTELLRDHPLFPDVALLSLNAVCYAERNPPLLQEFCDNNVTLCRYGSLYRHFQDIGRKNDLTWGCKVYRN